MGELFGLWVSEGAICNILARAQAPLEAAATAIAAQVTASDVVALDETSVRVMKKTCWEWVFVTAACLLHIIRSSRGAGVVRALFGAMRPQVWISDSLGSQRGHADRWQACLAHLLRDAQYAIDCGDGGFSTAFRRLLLRAIAIGRRRGDLRDSTLAQYRADLDRRLDHVLGLPREGEAAERLRRRIVRDREYLFVFVTNRRVPPTNNVSERALRPSVIFRKVTNGFRSEWGATPMLPSAPSSAPQRPTADPSSATSTTPSQHHQPTTPPRSRGEQLLIFSGILMRRGDLGHIGNHSH